MLKELREIGKYVIETKKSSGESEALNFVKILPGTFYVFDLIFDGKSFSWDYRQGSASDLEKILFLPGQARAVALLPGVYAGIDDKDPKKNGSGFVKLWETVRNCVKEGIVRQEVLSEFEKSFLSGKTVDFSSRIVSEISEKIKSFPLKDSKKNLILHVLALKIKDGMGTRYPGETPEGTDYFISKNKGDGAVFETGFCHACETRKNDIINFPKSNGVNFPYKFYNIDKPGFTYSINENNGFKSLGICQSCFNELKVGFKMFKEKMQRSILGERAYVFPTLLFSENLDIFKHFEKNKSVSELELSIVSEDSGDGDPFAEYSDFVRKFSDMDTRMNFLFGEIDSKSSDRLVINYFLQDVLPSRIGNIYESFNVFGSKIPEIKKRFFPSGNERLVEKFNFYLHPTYKKGEYHFNMRDFLSKRNPERKTSEYHEFLDSYLHGKLMDEREFWNIAYVKLMCDRKEGRIPKVSVFEIYVAHEYFSENKLFKNNQAQMENTATRLASANKNIRNLDEYFKNNGIFDSDDKIFAAMLGLYVKLLLNVQWKNLNKNTPFSKEINFESMDFPSLLKLLNKARDKFNKYSKTPNDGFPAVFRTILELQMRTAKTLPRDQLVYFFNVGMEILPDAFYGNGDEKEVETETNAI